MELAISTGLQGDHNKIIVNWFDHNNCPQRTVIDLDILQQDKPRTLTIRVDGFTVASVDSLVAKIGSIR